MGSADAAASSAEAPPPSPKPKEEAPPKPQPVKETARGSKYVPPCEVGDIVLVKALREEYNGFKGKVLTVLTGDVKVEMLEGPAVHTKGKVAKIKFAQVKKVTDNTEKAEPAKPTPGTMWLKNSPQARPVDPQSANSKEPVALRRS